jgi:hypothetical protein
MTFGYLALLVLAVCAVGAISLLRRASSYDKQDRGSVSSSWLAEHKSGRD